MSVHRYYMYVNFEQLLLNRKTSVNALSRISGVPRTTILDIVRGRSDMKKTSGITLYKIAKALDVSMEYLIELDSHDVINPETGKPTDYSYFEYSQNANITKILRNLKNSVYSGNELKQAYWKDQLLEEITSLRRKDIIGCDAYNYFISRYITGERYSD